MLAVEMLPAGHGDALVVEYGSKSRTYRMLVDAGPLHSWDKVSERLHDMPDKPYVAFVVTHVDEDHIGGAVALLKDPTLRHRITDVWFNGYVHSVRGGNVLGPVDGERLTELIVKAAHTWNDPFPRRISEGVGGPVVVSSKGALPCFELPGGALVHVLSPTGPKLKRMASVWQRVVEEEGLVPGKGTSRPPRPPAPYDKEVGPIPARLTEEELDALTAKTKTDPSEANGSSIALLFEFDDKRVLLGADAHPGVLVASLRRFGEAVGEERVRVDLCKLPHHCSRANVTSELIEAMDCGRYLVSTNGDNFGHPDDAAIARIIRSSSRAPTLYCNFRTVRTEPWVKRAAPFDCKVVLPKEGREGLRVSVR